MKNQIAMHVEHTWRYLLSEFRVNLFLLPIWQLVRLH